jgi:hypothetical protein
MSASGLHYILTSQFQSNERLAAYYDFAEYNGEINPESSGTYTGILNNQYPAYDTGKHTATIVSATGATEVGVSGLITGAVSGRGRLDQSNLKIPIEGLDIKSMSLLVDFQWNAEVENGVILGSYERFEETVGSVDVTGSRGFNFGVNDRGNMFFEAYQPSGPSIVSTNSIEMSERNIIGLSFDRGNVVFSKFDLFNDVVDKETFNFNSSEIAQPTDLYVGGSPQYFKSSSASVPTVNASLNELAIFSGSISAHNLKKLTSGILGDYFYNTGIQTVQNFITGYTDTVNYATGSTGTTLQSAGNLTVSTGRISYTGVLTGATTVSGSEGDEMYVFYNYDNDGLKTSYKEKLGYLDPSNSNDYAPTGECAFDTLGLQGGNYTLTGDIALNLETKLSTGSYSIYQQVEQTGVLGVVSGVDKTALYESVTGSTGQYSGIVFNESIEALKSDYIYYKGLR